MRLADLHRAVELEMQLRGLDMIPAAGDATLAVAGCDPITLTAGELADFIAWRRERLHAELRALGVEPEGRAAEVLGMQLTLRDSRDDAAAAEHVVGTYNREAAIEEAERRVIPGAVADFAAGRIDAEKFGRLRARHEAQIASLAAEILAAPRSVDICDRCAAPATTLINGQPYCADHAASAPRPAIPRFAA